MIAGPLPPETTDYGHQAHIPGKIHTTGTTNSSFVNTMSMLLRLFQYVCQLICVVHIECI